MIANMTEPQAEEAQMEIPVVKDSLTTADGKADNTGETPVFPAAPSVESIAESSAKEAEVRIKARDKRLKEMEKVGRDIQNKKADVSKQEAVVASAKSKLDSEREELHRLERELKEYQDDLDHLAVGGFVERLNLGKKSAKPPEKPGEAQPALESTPLPATVGESPADTLAWRAVKLTELAGLKTGRVIKALTDHNPPLTMMGELADWQEKKGDFWAKDIAGLGPKGREEIEDAQLAYWRASDPAAARTV